MAARLDCSIFECYCVDRRRVVLELIAATGVDRCQNGAVGAVHD
jgi:hypothetical protein